MTAENIAQVRRLRNSLGTHSGSFAVATDEYRETIPTRRLVPFMLTRLALDGYRMSAQLECDDSSDDGIMLILATQEGPV